MKVADVQKQVADTQFHPAGMQFDVADIEYKLRIYDINNKTPKILLKI